MSFDKSTRNALAKMVAACRERLAADISDQLQSAFGLYPDGTRLDVARTEADKRATAELRALLDYFIASDASGAGNSRNAYQRLVREIGFTTLNRLAALRLSEERGLVIECVRRGMDSDGFRLFDRVANGALGSRYATYRAFIEGMYDELALELTALFDRHHPHSHVFPGEAALGEVLALLNDPELAKREIWQQDETIGWIYQYYNDPAERKKMRDESQAPRNSRELAVRNQFFTPRYVVEFLTDNTLGRIWFEMTKGETSLKDSCKYLVRRPFEIFLKKGEEAPIQESDKKLSQEEFLQQPGYIPHRPLKDPREIKMLDPACGSMHFGLYSFDLFERIYAEAWDLEETLGEDALWRSPNLDSLHKTYPDRESFLRDVPRLVIERNIHGVDIDPRAVQIAVLSLWLRAQKSWYEQDVKPQDRPQIRRSNIVCAEPMPGDPALLDDFLATVEVPFIQKLVKEVFDKMTLAGEAGSLLKIEEEIRDSIAIAKQAWLKRPKTEQLGLWQEESQPQLEQLALFEGITDGSFWEQAEERVLDALRDYARHAENGKGTHRRLFVDDAERGFAFIDLCRRRYDVVLMNPPFGAPSKISKSYLTKSYPLTKNDIYAIFVERGLDQLLANGYFGAITSRTGFFLGSFQQWREKILLTKTQLVALADLGSNVLDEAVVEVASYVLNKKEPNQDYLALFYRLLTNFDKESQLISAINSLNSEDVFLTKPSAFSLIKSSPFAYWLTNEIREKLSKFDVFEPAAGKVRCGLSTGDNPRFVRTVWEINIPDVWFCYYPSSKEQVCWFSDPIVQFYFSRRKSHKQIWAPLIMAGAAQPWYSPITVMVNWSKDGNELSNTSSATLRSKSFYFRPGFSWTRRAVRMIPYVVQSNSIPTASRYMAYPEVGKEFLAIGVVASNLASSYMRMFGEKFEWPNFLVDNLKSLPWTDNLDSLNDEFNKLVSSEIENRRVAYRGHEPFQEFTIPFSMQKISSLNNLTFNYGSLIGSDLEQKVADTYDFDPKELRILERDVLEAVASIKGTPDNGEEIDEENETEEEQSSDFVLDQLPYTQYESKVSYIVGCIVGRWDVRLAIDSTLCPQFSGPFDPLPICPPGMLVGRDGLPAAVDNIVSKAWLRARPNAISLPQMENTNSLLWQGKTYPTTIPDGQYPIKIAWDGIFVDDSGLDRHTLHSSDIVRRVRDVLEVLWPENHADIEAEACEILGVKDLRDYFRKPSGFFADHLKRYSKSRRQAPIYWPLSTPSGSYTLWIYYHRLTDDILFTAVNRYVDPKIEQVERRVNALQAELGQINGKSATEMRDQLDELREFLTELRQFREELLRVANLPYKPDLNDGVILNAAPLYRLFRLNKWAKDTESAWKKLEAGDYDWAHIAYVLWPDRVRDMCKRDKSIAIAHGLESLYEGKEEIKKRKKKSKKVEEEQEDLEL